jgi:hypothetical protein
LPGDPGFKPVVKVGHGKAGALVIGSDKDVGENGQLATAVAQSAKEPLGFP